MDEGEPFEDVPAVETHAIDDADLVAVLQILAHPGQFHLHWNAERLQYVAAPDPRQHQELWRIERAAAEDDLARRLCLAEFTLCGRGLAMSAVQPLALQVFDAGGAVAFVEQHPRDERVEFDSEPVRVFLCHLQRALARAHPRMLA